MERKVIIQLKPVEIYVDTETDAEALEYAKSQLELLRPDELEIKTSTVNQV